MAEEPKTPGQKHLLKILDQLPEEQRKQALVGMDIWDKMTVEQQLAWRKWVKQQCDQRK